MIERIKLKQSDLLRLKQRNVIIYGYTKLAKDILDVFSYADINVVAFCCEIPFKRYRFRFKGIPVVNKKDLPKLKKRYGQLLVQPAVLGEQKLKVMRNILKKCKIEESDIKPDEIVESFNPEVVFRDIENPLKLKRMIAKWERAVNKKTNFHIKVFEMVIALRSNKIPVLLCLPGKTGDNTLHHTFNKINENEIMVSFNEKKCYHHFKKICKYIFGHKNHIIFFANTFHKPRYVNKNFFLKKKGTVKIITAVREPIGQTLSTFYESIQRRVSIEDWILGEIENHSCQEQEIILADLKRLMVGEHNDLQCWLDAFIERYQYTENHKNTYNARTVQEFIPEFSDSVVDITTYPFNQEKGYTIIKEANIEIFVYQLEKLNHLVPELSAFVGAPFDQLENGNQASDKWIAESYKQAQKEIKITQEYFDKCFEEPYVKHCYSTMDIEKFKDKWRTHIKGIQ